MRKLIVIIVIIIFFSCDNKKKKGSVDELFALKNIQIGMSKQKVIQNIGYPRDSTLMKNHLNELITIYQYETNNFSGYSLKVLIKNNLVVDINMD